MNTAEILSEIYSSSEITEVMNKVNPDSIRDDLKQHVFLLLLEKPEDFITSLHHSGKLKNYIVKVIFQLVHFKKDKFYSIQGFDRTGVSREVPIEFDIVADLSDNEDDNCSTKIKDITNLLFEDKWSDDIQEKAEDLCMKEVENLYWYDKKILKLYIQLGTGDAVAQEVGLAKRSVHNTIKKAKEQIRRRVLCQL